MRRRLPALKPRVVLRALNRAGFFEHHSTGSHVILKHPDQPAVRICVPYHSRDLKRKTLDSIIRQAGMSVEEFLDLL